MCYAQLANEKEAYAWAAKAMPPQGAPRSAWLNAQLEAIDARLAELDVLSD